MSKSNREPGFLRAGGCMNGVVMERHTHTQIEIEMIEIERDGWKNGCWGEGTKGVKAGFPTGAVLWKGIKHC